MIETMAEDEIDASAHQVWKMVADFGDVSWMKGVKRSETKGQGVGMARLIYAGNGPPVREVLEACDEAAKRISYTIPEGNPFPVKNYHATVTVVDVGSGKTRLEWRGRFEADGVSDKEAEATLRGMYGVLISWIKAAAEGA